MTTLLKNTCRNAMNYEDYKTLVLDLVQQKRTTGADTSEQKIAFTKLNSSRLKRLDKTISISDIALEHFRNLPSHQTWLIIVESWCADAVQTIPVLHKITSATSKLTLKIILRDENEEFMSHFLTNGAKSIPKLIVLDDQMEVINTWGSRSKRATQLVVDYKNEHGVIDDAFKQSLQLWYLKDGGKSIVEDLVALTASSKPTQKVVSAI
ncbi:MAG: thioredoxin family protein [Flavobacteriaceae bacterium]|nr:thioredoxin family protein [Flavobacteriaceae bacterium]